MHGTLHRRLPADFEFAEPALPDVHAARRHDDEPKRAVIDLDDVDAFLHAAVERAFAHRVALGLAADVARAYLPRRFVKAVK